MISWGMLTVVMAFMQTAKQFYVVRFLVGAAEAGFFPGVIVYLTHWFRYEDRGKAIAFFYAANPLSYVVGSPLAGLLLGITWLGLRGWRWLFILEGIPAILVGVITVFYLIDWIRRGGCRPGSATGLPSKPVRDGISRQLCTFFYFGVAILGSELLPGWHLYDHNSWRTSFAAAGR